MNIFILTDNKFWLEKTKKAFSSTVHNISFFCSPKGENLFKYELKAGEIQIIDLKLKTQFLIKNFDLGFSFHCKQIFPKKLVENVRCINIHPGLNPYNRGWFPQVFSILNNKPIGATIHIMDAEIDHGNILYQKEVDIYDWDTSKTIYERVLEAEFELFSKNLGKLLDKDIVSKKMPQEGNYNSIKDFTNLLEIDMEKVVTMGEAISFLRAMTHPPYRNAYFYTKSGVKVFVSLDIEI